MAEYMDIGLPGATGSFDAAEVSIKQELSFPSRGLQVLASCRGAQHHGEQWAADNFWLY